MLLDLTELEKGAFHQLSQATGAHLSHAAAICLEKSGHPEDVNTRGDGAYVKDYVIRRRNVTDKMKRTWNDLQDATEEGAVAIAIVQTFHESKFEVIERSKKGTGIDYWLGDKENFLFQHKARLEVSGSLNGDESELNSRLKEKVDQTKQSDETFLPAIIVVVGFRKPKILTAAR